MTTLLQSLQYVLETKDPRLPVETKRILLKEALQAYVLDFIYNHTNYRGLRFYGGTCLHVVYQLNRLSEDLDFDNSLGLDLSALESDLGNIFKVGWDYSEVIVKSQQGGQGILHITLKFPLLRSLGLSSYASEALHLKVEISHHPQVSVIQHTPIFYHGRSFVPAHFSLETMMAGKMIACRERSFQRGRQGAMIKGRDFYDLLWFMQQGIQPLAEKLAIDGAVSHTPRTAMQALSEKVAKIRTADLAQDLLPMFESRSFIEAWLEHFHENFARYAKQYL